MESVIGRPAFARAGLRLEGIGWVDMSPIMLIVMVTVQETLK